MAEDWKLRKYMEEMTPRRAIQNFFDHATPIDSPDPEDLVQPQDDNHEGTPIASQSSQGGALKRKILSQHGEASKGNLSRSLQQQSGEDSSILGLSELPSQLASPSIDPLPRPKAVNRKRVSMTPFSQVIQSQESQPSKVNEMPSIDDASFPSNLTSPDIVVSQRPNKKARISTSAFSKTLESHKATAKPLKSSIAADSSSLDSTGIPLSLESPVIRDRPGPKSSKKRISSLGLQKSLQDQPSNVNKSAASTPADPAAANNTTVPDALDSPEIAPTDFRQLNKQRKRISTTAFSQILEQRTAVDLHTKSLTEDSTSATGSASNDEAASNVSVSSYKTRTSNFLVEKFVNESGALRNGKSRVSRSFTSIAGHDEPEMQRSPEIVDVESPQEKSPRREPSDHAQSEIEPFNDVVEETIMKTQNSQAKRTLSPEDIEQYLSFSDDENSNQTNANEQIVEFTAREVQRPSQETKNGEESLIPNIVTTEGDPDSITDEDQVVIESPRGARSASNTSVVIKRNYSRPADRSAIAETTVNVVALPDIGSPEDFAPTASSTQLIKKKPLPSADQTVIEELLSEKNRSIPKKNLSKTSSKISQSGRDENFSVSDIPSKLNSPEEIKRDRLRAGPASSKKRVSTSDFFAVLNQKVIPPPRLETPRKQSPEPQPPQPEIVPVPPVNNEPMQALPERLHRSPSTASSATVQLNAERNDSSPDQRTNDSDEEPDSMSGMILLPEKSKTSQTLISVGRSRKSLIFDSIETSADITPDEESPASSGLQPNTPNVEQVKSDLATEEDQLASTANKTLEKSSHPEGRSRKSLRFESPVATVDITPAQETTASGSRTAQSNDEIVEETPSAEVEQDGDLPEEMPTEESVRRASTVNDRLSASVRKSEKSGLSPFNRYPALKNSTVVAGGAPFIDVSPLSMSPIVPSDKGSPSSIPTTPVTPAQAKKKPSRSIAHSPMYVSVMQKAFKQQGAQRRLTATTPIPSKTAEKSLRKGASLSNTLKGKSITLAAVSEDHEPSETEDDEAEENVPLKPIPIEVAFRKRDTIPDRSKNYVPLEQRLREDPAFQAKVNVQKAKIEAAKAVEKASAARAQVAQRKTRASTAKKVADNIASVATNKGNLRFYSKFKVAKDALDVTHEVVGEWLDFTLDQMETFCDEEGVALDTWENCYKMLKRQNIVKNAAEYTGLCHDLLLNDEAQDLLPSEFPVGHYESKRQAKRRRML